MTQKPELLAPAGTPAALDAAIMAGADAIYFGTSGFNARMLAGNFDENETRAAVRKCAFYGVKSHITLNTLVGTREIDDFLRTAETVYRLGADALIVADLGMAALLHRYFPDLPLHASTQAAGQNTDAARFLQSIGFSRMVTAREIDSENLRTLCQNAPIEIEAFVHGALCVSQSGQCLLSAMVGGRSGNRGTCAQPCRMPYRYDGKGNEEYPLSLKDLCLAGHLTALTETGVASLKIEGRMKSPAYVYGVTSVYRRLLDEKRDATEDEIRALGALFSRSGFTDGYFTRRVNRTMTGIRREADKDATRAAEKAALSALNEAKKSGRKLPVTIKMKLSEGQKATLTMALAGEDTAVTVTGEIPTPAAEPMQHAEENLAKLGATPFSAASVSMQADTDKPLSLPRAALNALRRDAAERLEALLYEKRNPARAAVFAPYHPENTPEQTASKNPEKIACFFRLEQIDETANAWFDRICLPLDAVCENPEAAKQKGVGGVVLPPVAFDAERKTLKEQLETVKRCGITHAMTGSIGQLALLNEIGMTVLVSYRANVFSRESAAVLHRAGADAICLSAELTLPQLRDIAPDVPKGAVVYGRLPLMTLERCVIADTNQKTGTPCDACRDKKPHSLTDRTGASFPLLPAHGHRNLLVNSVPFWMADRRAALAQTGCDFYLFLFTVEDARAVCSVIDAWDKELSPAQCGISARRIAKS